MDGVPRIIHEIVNIFHGDENIKHALTNYKSAPVIEQRSIEDLLNTALHKVWSYRLTLDTACCLLMNEAIEKAQLDSFIGLLDPSIQHAARDVEAMMNQANDGRIDDYSMYCETAHNVWHLKTVNAISYIHQAIQSDLDIGIARHHIYGMHKLLNDIGPSKHDVMNALIEQASDMMIDIDRYNARIDQGYDIQTKPNNIQPQ